MSTSLAKPATQEASLAPVAVTALGGFLYFSTKRAAVKAAVVALTLFATVVTNAFGDKIAAYWRAVRARTDAQAALVSRFFSRREQCLAATILATACAHNGHAHTGCYAEPSFFAYEHVALPAMRDARDRLLRATGCVRA